MDDPLDIVENHLSESAEMTREMIDQCTDNILQAARLIVQAIEAGHKILWCGNGGSAAQAQHLSTELVGGLRDHARSPIPSISLTTDSSLLTAWSNDVSFETVFSRQVEGLGEEGDVLVAISTSGNSMNVVKAVETAERKRLRIVILTGDDAGQLRDKGDCIIRIPSSDTQHIQEGHIAAGHIFCEIVEQSIV